MRLVLTLLYWLIAAALALAIGIYATFDQGQVRWPYALACGGMCLLVYYIVDSKVRYAFEALTQDRSEAFDEFRRLRAPLDDEETPPGDSRE